MSDLSPKEAAMLRPHLKAFLDLVEGRRKPQTDAQRLFLECAKGVREPVTGYEIAFVKWLRDRPDLEGIIARGGEDRPTPRTPKKKRRKAKVKAGMSVAQAKKLKSRARWTPEEIEAHHKKSGYYRGEVVVLQGGKVSPR